MEEAKPKFKHTKVVVLLMIIFGMGFLLLTENDIIQRCNGALITLSNNAALLDAKLGNTEKIICGSYGKYYTNESSGWMTTPVHIDNMTIFNSFVCCGEDRAVLFGDDSAYNIFIDVGFENYTYSEFCSNKIFVENITEENVRKIENILR